MSCTCLVLCIFASCCENEFLWELDEEKVIKYEGKWPKKLLISAITKEKLFLNLNFYCQYKSYW